MENDMIETLEFLFTKFGINNCDLPTLVERVAAYEIKLDWIGIAVGLIFLLVGCSVGLICSKVGWKKYQIETKDEPYFHRNNSYSEYLIDCAAGWLVCIVMCALIGLAFLIVNGIDVVGWLIDPQVRFINYIR